MAIEITAKDERMVSDPVVCVNDSLHGTVPVVLVKQYAAQHSVGNGLRAVPDAPMDHQSALEGAARSPLPTEAVSSFANLFFRPPHAMQPVRSCRLHGGGITFLMPVIFADLGGIGGDDWMANVYRTTSYKRFRTGRRAA